MIRAVLLDYDGTLITFDREAAFAAALGPQPDAATRAGLARRLAEEDRYRALQGCHDLEEVIAWL